MCSAGQLAAADREAGLGVAGNAGSGLAYRSLSESGGGAAPRGSLVPGEK